MGSREEKLECKFPSRSLVCFLHLLQAPKAVFQKYLQETEGFNFRLRSCSLTSSLVGWNHIGAKQRHPGCPKDRSWESTAWPLSTMTRATVVWGPSCQHHQHHPGPSNSPAGEAASPTLQMCRKRLQEVKTFPHCPPAIK